MKFSTTFFLGMILAAFLVSSAWAEVISIDTFGTSGNDAGYFGLRVTTIDSTANWDDIKFNYFDSSGGPVALGTLHLLSIEYLGTPADLGAGTPGLIAISTGIAGGEWSFSPTVTLLPNTTYYFYSNGLFTIGSIYGHAETDGYYSPDPDSNFEGDFTADPNYRLTGKIVPESTSLALATLGLIGGVYWRWRGLTS